ncbi:MAG: hypothetical protein KQI81_24380 [Deltaproteobacteria bacterium]|nr:hypothetical protein [Deltaproteobacteria bacterium]
MKTKPIMLRTMLLACVFLFVATATSALAMSEELIGTVVKTDKGAALSTDAGEYLILGKDLESYTGDTVAVTGDVEIGAMAKTIRVASVSMLDINPVVKPPAAKKTMHHKG